MDDDLTVRLERVLAVIVVVISLGLIEMIERFDFGDDGRGELAGLVQLTDEAFGLLSLRVAGIENDRAVLRAGIIALAVKGGGIVRREKDDQEIAIGDQGWVEFDARAFGVAGSAATNIAIGGVRGVPASVTRRDSKNSIEVFEHSVRAPETASAEDGNFTFFGHCVILSP